MKKIVAILLLLGILCMFDSPLYASETETKVQYRMGDTKTLSFVLSVSGKGAVYDGTQSISNGTLEYELRVGEEKQFRIVPDHGYKIKHIYYEPQASIQDSRFDIQNQLIDEYLTLSINKEAMRLEIEFDVIKDQSTEEIDKPLQNPNQETSESLTTISPATSDSSNRMNYTLLLIGSYLILVIMKSNIFEMKEGNGKRK